MPRHWCRTVRTLRHQSDSAEMSGSSPVSHLARMVIRVKVRVKPFSRSREVRKWTRPEMSWV